MEVAVAASNMGQKVESVIIAGHKVAITRNEGAHIIGRFTVLCSTVAETSKTDDDNTDLSFLQVHSADLPPLHSSTLVVSPVPATGRSSTRFIIRLVGPLARSLVRRFPSFVFDADTSFQSASSAFRGALRSIGLSLSEDDLAITLMAGGRFHHQSWLPHHILSTLLADPSSSCTLDIELSRRALGEARKCERLAVILQQDLPHTRASDSGCHEGSGSSDVRSPTSEAAAQLHKAAASFCLAARHYEALRMQTLRREARSGLTATAKSPAAAPTSSMGNPVHSL